MMSWMPMMRKLLLALLTISLLLGGDAPSLRQDIKFRSLVGTSFAAGGAMICGPKIIHAGDSQYLLIARFGKPESREFVGVAQIGDACVKAEEWLYVCRQYAKPKMYVIRIVGTTISSIRWLPDVQ